MRKVLLLLGLCLGLLIVAGTLVYTVDPLRDEAAWRWATLQGGEEDYAEYLRERPDGRHADEARRHHDDKVWQRAEAADTLAAFNRYLKVYASGQHAQDARSRVDAIHWNKAQAANTLASYETYLRISPRGDHADEARMRLIANLACAGVPTRRVPLYRAPSLFLRLDVP